MTDLVKHPKHYNMHPSGIECWDIAKYYDFLMGNVIKYIWRAGLKNTENVEGNAELRDLLKAREYLDKKIEELKASSKDIQKIPPQPKINKDTEKWPEAWRTIDRVSLDYTIDPLCAKLDVMEYIKTDNE